MSGAARRLSRRELLGLGAAAGMVAATGSKADAPPERGGSLRLGLAGRGIGTFDGRRPFDPIMRILGHGAAFDCLTEIGADGALTGELAIAWEAGPDARLWHLRLREDAVFHDGRPFTAADAVATLRRHVVAGTLDGVAQVRRAGPHEVAIALRAGNPGLPFLLADPQLVMLPAEGADEAMAAGIGTGLYRLAPGVTVGRAVLHRVNRHYKDGRAGWFERLEVLALSDPRARFGALLAGRVDAVNLADPAWATEIRRHGRLALAEVPGAARLEISVEGAPETTARAVAAAVGGALDRTALLGLCGNRGTVLNDMPLPAGGGPLPAAVSVCVSPERVPGAEALGRALEAAARRAGLAVTPEARMRIVARLRPVPPTPDWRLGGGRDPAFAARLTEARATPEAATRAERIAALGAEAAATRPVLVPVALHGLFAHATRLRHGPRIGALWDMDSSRIAERWWYT